MSVFNIVHVVVIVCLLQQLWLHVMFDPHVTLLNNKIIMFVSFLNLKQGKAHNSDFCLVGFQARPGRKV